MPVTRLPTFARPTQQSRSVGLVKLGTIAVEVTKVKANASRHKAMRYGRMQAAEIELKAQTAVDEAAHITVAAEVVNTSLDVQQLPTVLAAVKAHTESVIALGREGKEQARPTDAQRYPHTVAMQAKSQTNKGKADYRKRKRKRKWIVEPPNGAATLVPKMFWCLTPSTTQRATLACSLTPRPMTPMQT